MYKRVTLTKPDYLMTLICPMLSISRRLGLRCGIELERWIESLVTDASLKSKPTFRFAFFLGFLCFFGFRVFVFALDWDIFVRSLAFLRAGLREVNRASPISPACYFQ